MKYYLVCDFLGVKDGSENGRNPLCALNGFKDEMEQAALKQNLVHTL